MKNKSNGSDTKANDGKESEVDGHSARPEEKVDKGDTDSESTNPDRPLWRGRICYLLNDNLSILGKAKIVVCFPDEPFDEENLGTPMRGFSFFWMGTFR